MPEYIFQGTVTLSGVDFYIIADSEEEAKAKAKNGEYNDRDTVGAGSQDWDIDPNSCALNE